MKRNLIMSVAVLLLSIGALPSTAESNPSTAITTASPAEALRAETLINRLHEINDMDKSTLSRSEKHALRKEVRSIKNEMTTQNSGGLYISVGAAIIIVLLLILLL